MAGRFYVGVRLSTALLLLFQAQCQGSAEKVSIDQKALARTKTAFFSPFYPNPPPDPGVPDSLI
jgi:hypothetical protein